jgi:hypothetical protein
MGVLEAARDVIRTGREALAAAVEVLGMECFGPLTRGWVYPLWLNLGRPNHPIVVGTV